MGNFIVTTFHLLRLKRHAIIIEESRSAPTMFIGKPTGRRDLGRHLTLREEQRRVCGSKRNENGK